jgi:hypothetical protein
MYLAFYRYLDSKKNGTTSTFTLIPIAFHQEIIIFAT